MPPSQPTKVIGTAAAPGRKAKECWSACQRSVVGWNCQGEAPDPPVTVRQMPRVPIRTTSVRPSPGELGATAKVSPQKGLWEPAVGTTATAAGAVRVPAGPGA